MSDSALIIQLIVRKGLVSKEQLRILEEGNERIDPNGLFEELVKKGFVERKTVYRISSSSSRKSRMIICKKRLRGNFECSLSSLWTVRC